MNDSWLTLILLGIAASFMPLVFGLEIVLLGSDDGVKRTSSLAVGITVFRVLAAVGVALLFAGGAVAVGQGISNIGAFLGSTLSQFGQDVASGQHVLLDILLVAAGILLMISAYRHIRGGHGADQSSEHEDSKAFSVGVVGMVGREHVFPAEDDL